MQSLIEKQNNKVDYIHPYTIYILDNKKEHQGEKKHYQMRRQFFLNFRAYERSSTHYQWHSSTKCHWWWVLRRSKSLKFNKTKLCVHLMMFLLSLVFLFIIKIWFPDISLLKIYIIAINVLAFWKKYKW